MNEQAVVVLITVPDRETGKRIARRLVEERLAACANLLPGITSIYTWEGKINEDDELLLIVKTRRELFADRLVPLVRAEHPYDLPEILALPVDAGLPEYLEWVLSATGGA